jgi:hypothetical protein
VEQLSGIGERPALNGQRGGNFGNSSRDESQIMLQAIEGCGLADFIKRGFEVELSRIQHNRNSMRQVA